MYSHGISSPYPALDDWTVIWAQPLCLYCFFFWEIWLLKTGSLSEANHDTLNKYFGGLKYFWFVTTKSYYMGLDGHWHWHKSLQLPYMLMRQNFDSIWSEISKGTTYHKQPPRLNILGSHLRVVFWYTGNYYCIRECSPQDNCLGWQWPMFQQPEQKSSLESTEQKATSRSTLKVISTQVVKNVGQRHPKQSFSGLHSSRQSYFT